ncbi:Prolylcarboxypeptidase (angiotensinase C) [Handroanthus impetiginosus]|uniref:Prolylcarboxypeptidase (Angiotensinase C) n=1 Tax=Handroanthus impetiginosus TaxID=429701 RepID=A0A2G9GEM1_9LAMI|nr:Prolylcarboxypeptidase (angiotensinase C) [Handroanthus impetiginosus]
MMTLPFKLAVLLFQLYPLLLLLDSVSAFPHKIPRLSPHYKHSSVLKDPHKTSSASGDDFKAYFYTQTLDHFNYAPESYATFELRYVINSRFWGGANSTSAIFAYLGAEAPLQIFSSFMMDIAPLFKALVVFIEHRFYGESVPFGSMEKAMKNKTIRGYFNSAQAIADYAEVLLHIKDKFSAHESPIIVTGGSYGGMLASWFRLKYPNIALGALASSAPVLYFDKITPQNGYYSIVTEDFKEASTSCYRIIQRSWSEIDRIASKPNGLSILSRKFKTCRHLNSSNELKNYLDDFYSYAAQYNPVQPVDSVKQVCDNIDGASKGTDILGRIFRGIVSFEGNQTCYDTNEYSPPDETHIGWYWQTCSEMVMPIGRGENDTMFPAAPFNLQQFNEDCKASYGVSPRPHWVTTYYGGLDIKLVLRRFGSNIIFSNGLKDPYSSGGVLQDISESILAVTTLNGSHCLDLYSATETDPKWLTDQRNKELNIIKGWIKQYYIDLHALKK